MSNIKLYKGIMMLKGYTEIRKIALKWYSKEIYNNYYGNLSFVKNFLKLINPFNKMKIVLSNNWFIYYLDSKKEIDIWDWVSINNNSFIDKKEMFDNLINLLIDNKDKMICGYIRHDISYNIYEKLKDKGYIIEFSDVYQIDNFSPKKVKDFLHNKLDNYIYTNVLLTDEEKEKYREYLPYLLHGIVFKVSSKFLNEYEGKTKRYL